MAHIPKHFVARWVQLGASSDLKKIIKTELMIIDCFRPSHFNFQGKLLIFKGIRTVL